jgi:hypothetical protein
MSSSNLTLYRVLVKLGAEEAAAEQAAQLDTAALVTKADLAELKAELLKHTTRTLVWTSGINAGLLTLILTLFRFLGGTP